MDDVRETEDVYRLYRDEWVIVKTITGTGEHAQPFVEQAYAYVDDTFEGRVPKDRFDVVAHTDLADTFWVHVRMYRPNMKGEFKQAFLAGRYAEKQGYAQWEIVSRNSKRDYELRNYGVRKLQ